MFLICSKYYKEKKERILHAQATFDSEEEEQRTMPNHGWSVINTMDACNGWMEQYTWSSSNTNK